MKSAQRDYFGSFFDSPVGKLRLIASEEGLVAVLWPDDDPARVRTRATVERDRHPLLVMTQRQLVEYFAGQRSRFTVPLDFVGTKFQRSVWQALLTIPFGETRTYGQIAQQLRCPSASRAVGAANGKNPISILVPCHRVIGANGNLTGFAGGLEVKAKLLQLEATGAAN